MDLQLIHEEYHQLEQENIRLKEQLKKSYRQIEKLGTPQNNNGDLELDNKILQEKNTLYKKKIEEEKGTKLKIIQSLEEKKENLEEHIEELVKKLEESLIVVDELIMEKQQLMTDLSKKGEEESDELKKLKAENEQLVYALYHAQENVQSLEEEKFDANDLVQGTELLEEERIKNSKHIQSLEKEKEYLEEHVEELVKKLGKSKITIEKLNAEKQQLQIDLSKEEEIADLKKVTTENEQVMYDRDNSQEYIQPIQEEKNNMNGLNHGNKRPETESTRSHYNVLANQIISEAKRDVEDIRN